MMDSATKKNTGSFYTCNAIADFIAKWAIDSEKACVLEPSFGDGIFIDSAISRFAELGNSSPAIIGVEIQEEPFEAYLSKHECVTGFQMDFMDYRSERCINAVIGNPPYVSLKKLKEAERKKALQLVNSYGVDMQTSGSLWMPFVVHSTALLAKGGKLGFVLPYEITHVRYAFDLWRYLAKNYGRITVCRVYYDFFPDVDVETIVLLAEEKGYSTEVVHYRVFETLVDMDENREKHSSYISVNDIIALKKPFERELMPQSVRNILDDLRKRGKIAGLVRDCKFKIGYVSGNKEYFQMSEDDIQRMGIRPENVKKSLMNAKQINANTKCGIETEGISSYSYLFYPTVLGDGEKEYIDWGKEQGVDIGYKCRVRNPWYLTPGLEIPDLVLTVFGDVPKLLCNNGSFYISNSLLGGFSKASDSREIICRWYNSLTLLSIEATIHSLGGGTLVLIPGETDKLEVVSEFPTDQINVIYAKFLEFAKSNKTEDLYRYGDEVVLKELYGLSDKDVREIRNALWLLRNWRSPDKRRG